MFLFLLGTYLGMELLDHMVPLFNFLKNQSVKRRKKEKSWSVFGQ